METRKVGWEEMRGRKKRDKRREYDRDSDRRGEENGGEGRRGSEKWD